MRLSVTKSAKTDLSSIWNYIAADNQAAADRLVERIYRRITMLVNNPASGRTREEIAPGVRSVSVGSYIIFYRISKQTVVVNRVLHGARDLQNAYEQGPD